VTYALNEPVDWRSPTIFETPSVTGCMARKVKRVRGIPHHLRLGREELERKVILVWRQCRDLVCDLFHLDPNFSSVVKEIAGIIEVDGGGPEPAHAGGKDWPLRSTDREPYTIADHDHHNERFHSSFTAHSIEIDHCTCYVWVHQIVDYLSLFFNVSFPIDTQQIDTSTDIVYGCAECKQGKPHQAPSISQYESVGDDEESSIKDRP
jgi:hypothetical protein